MVLTLVGIGQVTSGQKDLLSPFSPVPQLSHSPPPVCSRPEFSLSSTQTCGNEPTLQCSTSRYCCRERRGKDSVLREGNRCMFQLGKTKRIEILGIFFFSAVLLLPLIFLTPLQSSAWCCFSRDMKTLDFRCSWDPLLLRV